MDGIFEIFEDILSDDEEEFIDFVVGGRAPRNFNARIDDMNSWNDKEFVNRFRLSKGSINVLLNQIGPVLERNTPQNHALSPLTQILVTLRFYACGSMLIVAGDFGGIHKSTTSRTIKQVSQAIASLAPNYIKMSETEEQIVVTKNKFHNIARFPNVVGAIDCTHVRIQSPGGDNAEQFRNRKGWFSINVQTVADANLKIIDIVARWPGAANDRFIFNNCRLKARLEQGMFGISYILGDSGYTLTPSVLTPLANPQTHAENLYNECHIRTRNVVERQYGIWKRRFQVLRLEMRLKLSTALTVIVATAVLHNLAVQMNDPEPPPDGYEDINVNDDQFGPIQGNGHLVRENLINNYFAEL